MTNPNRVGVLHWLFGPHPLAKRHPHGIQWLLLAAGWAIVGALIWLQTTAIIVNTCDNAAKHIGCNHQGSLGGILAGLFGAVTLGLTLAMVWQAEERRLNRAENAEIEREARAERIRRLEKEAGIGV